MTLLAIRAVKKEVCSVKTLMLAIAITETVMQVVEILDLISGDRSGQQTQET